MINSPFTAEEKADLQFLDIMELLDVNVVKNFIRLFPPQDNALYLGIKYIDSKYPKKWLTKSRIENIAGLRPKNITEIGEESHIPKSKNGIYTKPKGWKTQSINTPYRQYGIPPANTDNKNNKRYSENDKEIYPQWWPDYDETAEAERSKAIVKEMDNKPKQHKHHHHITDYSNQVSTSVQTNEKESIAVQANPGEIQSLYVNNNNNNNKRSNSVPPNLSKSLRYNNNKQRQSSHQYNYNNDYYNDRDYNYNYNYYYRNQPPQPSQSPPPPPPVPLPLPPSNISPYYIPPPPPPSAYYYPLESHNNTDDYYYYYKSPSQQQPPLSSSYPPLPPPQYGDYSSHYYPPPSYDYNNNNKHITIEEPVDMIVNHPKASSKLLKRCATPYPYPRRKYDDNGNEIDIAL